jgi:hypothetical protein
VVHSQVGITQSGGRLSQVQIAGENYFICFTGRNGAIIDGLTPLTGVAQIDGA